LFKICREKFFGREFFMVVKSFPPKQVSRKKIVRKIFRKKIFGR
jgi:hypothetical protein